MRFAIITHTKHKAFREKFFGYGPYVREMNVWGKYADQIEVVAPLHETPATLDAIDLAYENPEVVLTRIPAFDIIGTKAKIKALLQIPGILAKIYGAMKRADHIHLRCPGNIGLLGCFVQILFPTKPKTAKYAGNWDPGSVQPASYRLQKWILSNTFLTRNMKVLVYGEWPQSNKNMLPFFTATYKDSDKTEIVPRKLDTPIRFLFIGALAPGKRPMYALEIIKSLNERGLSCTLELLGEGKERPALERKIRENGLSDRVFLRGNQNETTVRERYQKSHFVLLPSRSEGWPKVLAEAMFWASVPISTQVSCIPQMLDRGSRGILLELDLEKDVQAIQDMLSDASHFNETAIRAMDWSRQFTLDRFELEIKKLMLAR